MKSFKQYISEIATDVVKDPNFSVDSDSPNLNLNSTNHQYYYKDHDQFVHFNHAHEEPHERTGLKGKHHSYISFVVDGEVHRTDTEDLKSASQKLSNVSHAIAHHIDDKVKPNKKKNGVHYFSYHASKEAEDSGKNPKAREQTYHMMAKRLMQRHGYEYHDTVEEPHSGELRYIYKKKSEKT